VPQTLYNHYASNLYRPFCYDAGPCDWYRYLLNPDDDAFIESPSEPLVEAVGDCEDTGILYCSIVRPSTPSTHLVFFPTHVASAVHVSWDFINS